MASSTFHTIIIGGGIGGLCLAQALKQAGASVAVYERNSATVWPEGYRIHINPIGSKALYRCLPPALWDAFVAAAGKPPAGLGFLTEQLRELVVVGENVMAGEHRDPSAAHYPVNRIVLRHLLMAGVQDAVHFDQAFERYERTADSKVTVCFADGTSATADVLIGADGANSKVRKQLLPHARRVATGAAGIGGKLPLTKETRAWLPRQLLSRMNLIMAPSRYTLFNAAFNHGEVSPGTRGDIAAKARAAGLDAGLLIDDSQDYLLWAFIAPADTFPSGAGNLDGQELQRFVLRLVHAWHPDIYRLVSESDPRSISLNPFKTMLPVAPWESSNVTLLGDAIHNMPPVGGLGGNMALRDASLLAQMLASVHRGEQPIMPAIQTYEAEMRKYGFAAVQVAVENTHRAISSNRAARGVGRAWFRLCNALPPLKRKFEHSWMRQMSN